MTATSAAITLQVRDDDTVVEPCRELAQDLAQRTTADSVVAHGVGRVEVERARG
jgi:hypothetical protein